MTHKEIHKRSRDRAGWSPGPAPAHQRIRLQNLKSRLGGIPNDGPKFSLPNPLYPSCPVPLRRRRRPHEMPPAEDAPPQTPPPTRWAAAGSRVLLQSPPPAFPLGSNDDQQERARARAAARAASVRRRSLAASIAPSKDPRHDLLNREQVMDLFHNCIKLASENVGA